MFLETRDYFLTGEEFKIQQCDHCMFKFVNPRPDPDEIVRYYQSENYISHDAQSKNLFNRAYKIAREFSIRKKYNIVKQHVSSGTILDIGCGTGEFLYYCKSRGYDVSGVEPNEKAMQYARQVNGLTITENLFSLEANSVKFNGVTLWHVLEHLHALNESLITIKGLLAPGGILIIAVPNCNSWDAHRYGKYWAAYDVPRHLYHFTEETLKILIEKHGFKVNKVLPQKLDAYYVTMLSEKYLTGRSNYVKSLFLGLWSNFQARMQNRGHSSQIFVLSVKKA